MITDIKAEVRQTATVLVGEGDDASPKMTKLGAMFNADWKTQLLMAGLAWQARVGSAIAGSAASLVLGGGSGTTTDSDQPELVIGVDAGYFLIPIDCKCAIQGNFIAQSDKAEILLFADRSAAPVDATGAASGVLHTPINMLDGGGAFPGRCWVQCTGDITDPVTSQILDYVTFQQTINASAAGSSPILKMDYQPAVPTVLAGPCQVVLCWGGTSGMSGLGVITVAAVPASYFAD